MLDQGVAPIVRTGRQKPALLADQGRQRQLVASVGRADAFADPFWINARSSMFGEPGDAEPVIDAVRSALAPDTP